VKNRYSLRNTFVANSQNPELQNTNKSKPKIKKYKHNPKVEYLKHLGPVLWNYICYHMISRETINQIKKTLAFVHDLPHSQNIGRKQTSRYTIL